MNKRDEAKRIIDLVSLYFQSYHKAGVQGEPELCDSCTSMTDESIVSSVCALLQGEETMTEQQKLAASIIDEVSDVVERQHPEVERGDDALIYDREYYDLENIIVQMLPSVDQLQPELAIAKENLKATDERLQEYEHQILQLTGEGLILNAPQDLGDMTDDKLDLVAHDLRSGKKIFSIKQLRGLTLHFSYLLPDGRYTRLRGHIGLKYANQIVSSISRAIKHERKEQQDTAKTTYKAYDRQFDELRGLLSDRCVTIESLEDTVASLREERDGLEEKVGNHKATIRSNSEGQEAAYRRLKAECAEHLESIAGHEAVNSDLCEQIENYKAMIKANSESQSIAVADLRKERDYRIESEIESLTTALENKAEYITSLEAERDELKIKVSDLNRECSEKSEFVEELSAAFEEKKQELSNYEFQSTPSTVEDLNAEILELERKLRILLNEKVSVLIGLTKEAHNRIKIQ